MHHALLLPEIVATIVQSESSSPGFLHTCLFISKTFSFEACRILWYACGACEHEENEEHATPKIINLARIVIQNVTRAQYYADFIHVLTFDKRFEAECRDEASWHKELVSLQFPQLQHFTLHESVEATERNTGDMIIHYAQPNIEAFVVYQGSGISDSLLEKFTKSCPRLEILELSRISAGNISRDGLTRFCNEAHALTYLAIRAGAYTSWSYEAFEAIARLPELTYLKIPDVQDNWFYSICNTDSSTPIFPSLQELHTGMSDQELEDLPGLVPNLYELVLDLRNFPRSNNILELASNFPNLTLLEITFGVESRVSGYDLLLLARKCPLLESLEFGSYVRRAPYPSGCRCCPSIDDLSDDLIDEVARALGARILLLRITLDTSDLLTWQSILSLAQHCRNLQDLAIPCDFDWQETMNGKPKYILPALNSLYLIFDRNIRQIRHANDYEEETIEYSASRMFDFAPELSRFGVKGGNDADNRWAAKIRRYYDSVSQ
ncbi:af27899a-7e4c-4850-858e-e205638955ff-CDS [Sclerotinia trifoliorum]|uniref:Af27899a-7e4c-4850-858e-e205638955ff-CDS n=1 Tax=Sclerotinia trifoliorum TaxID=28548 RepID=A0A8H2VYB2_9HELO|nr:af27899a-7e4c-4850-858e-e205638955ff-CDS [Sclerotinia trifoliorum]